MQMYDAICNRIEMSARCSERLRHARASGCRGEDMGRSPKPTATAVRASFLLGQRTRAEWLQLGAVAALSLALVAQAAQTAVQLWKLGRMPAAGRIPAARLADPAQARAALSALVRAHLFGKAPEAPAELPGEAAAPWVLTGTLQGVTPDSGAAILGHSTTTTRFCAAGQEVAGGFRLIEVFPDRVTLERDGERVSLRLPRTTRGTLVGPMVQLAAEQPAHVPRPLEERTRERPQNETQARLELRPSLHRGAGRFDGMRVLGTGDGSNLAPYGLRRNDIIREVDGQPINNIDAQYRALDALSRGRPVDVTVQRNGNVFTLQLGFTDIGG
jgi:type II secretory pathway component PulC